MTRAKQIETTLAAWRAKGSGFFEITEVNGPIEFIEPESGWVWRITTEGRWVHVRTQAPETAERIAEARDIQWRHSWGGA